MRTPKIPPGAEVVRTYCELNCHVNAFFKGKYHLLVVIGGPGLAKSSQFEAHLGPTSHLIKGWTAPLQAFIDCFLHRNKLLIFDDAETLWQKPAGRILLRSLCEHKPWKGLQWASTAGALQAAGVPQRFETSSKVAIIANHFVFGDIAEFEAVADRAHIIYFDPYPTEVHEQVASWFYDQVIYDFIGERLHLISGLSARVYLKAFERKQAGGDWRHLIESVYCHDLSIKVVQDLEADPDCPTVEQKVAKFITLTGACRATYFNLKRELRDNHQLPPPTSLELPKRTVQGTPPPEVDIDEEVAKARQEDEHRNQHPLIGKDGDEWKSTETPASSTSSSHEPEVSRPEVRGSGAGNAHTGLPPDDDLLSWLQRKLREAIRREEYERAAYLSNRIKKLQENPPP